MDNFFFILYIAAWNYLDSIGKEFGQQHEGSMQQQIIYFLVPLKFFPEVHCGWIILHVF